MAWRVVKPLAVLLVGLLSVAYAAPGAENWPGRKPLRFEAGSAAGGLIDLVPRVLSKYLSPLIGVPVVVEDRPGAGGNIAAGFVAKARPDGHALLIIGSNEAVNPTLLPNPGFDYHRDLAPVAMILSAKMLLVASTAFPAKDITEVIALARKKPKSISFATSMIGTPTYLAAQMLAQYGNIDLTFVPYDGGAQALPDLIANRVNLTISAMSTMLPLVRNRQLKALAVLSPQRSPLAPEIPTSAQSGLPQLQLEGWICLMTTGGTPAPVIARLDAAIAKVLTLPEVREAFAKRGVEIFYMNAHQLGPFMHAEAARFESLLKHSRVLKPSQ